MVGSSSTTFICWRLLCVMVLTSLVVVDCQVNLLPNWSFGRNRGGDNLPLQGRNRGRGIIRPRGNCATYIDTSMQPTCAPDEIVYFDLHACQLTCGAADGVPNEGRTKKRFIPL